MQGSVDHTVNVTTKALVSSATSKVPWADICSANGGYNLTQEDLQLGDYVAPMVDSDGYLYVVADQEELVKNKRYWRNCLNLLYGEEAILQFNQEIH